MYVHITFEYKIFFIRNPAKFQNYSVFSRIEKLIGKENFNLNIFYNTNMFILILPFNGHRRHVQHGRKLIKYIKQKL